MLLYLQYIYSLIIFTVNNKHLYNTNNEIYKCRARYNNTLHLSIVSLEKFNKGTYFTSMKVFNHLLEHIKILTNDIKCFKSILKRFLYQHSFHSIEAYFEYKSDRT